jgi:hypothetical protein
VIAPPACAGGVFCGIIEGYRRTEPQETALAGDRQNDPKGQELKNRGLAPATFAFQLAAFEIRLQLAALEIQIEDR